MIWSPLETGIDSTCSDRLTTTSLEDDTKLTNPSNELEALTTIAKTDYSTTAFDASEALTKTAETDSSTTPSEIESSITSLVIWSNITGSFK